MLAKYITSSTFAVVFTGAGMSTESGLMDFRSADCGMWNNRNPAELASVEAMNVNREQFVAFYRWRLEEMSKHQPNEGHRILARWEKEGIVKGIITQNVENYHELAGSINIAKLHGDLGTVRCEACGASYPSEVYLPPSQRTECGCGGFLRPNVVLFGEMLPRNAWSLAEKLMEETDLLIVLGSSLQVSPANGFPLQAKRRGASLVIVNRDPTPADRYADLVIHDSIGDVLRSADAVIRTRTSP